MNFGFSDDQQAIKRTARDFLAARYPLATVRRLAEDDRGFTDEQWQELVELGWPGVIVPEDRGGLGLGAIELVVIAEEMGYALAPSPWFSTTCAALMLAAAGTEEQRERWLEPLAAGEARGTLAVWDEHAGWAPDHSEVEPASDGTLSCVKIAVPDAASADFVIVSGADGRHFLHNVSDPGITLVAESGIDPTRKLFRVELRRRRRGAAGGGARGRGARVRDDRHPARRRERRRRPAGDGDGGRLREGSDPVRPADRLLPGGLAPVRADAARGRGRAVAVLLGRLGARQRARGRAAGGVDGQGVRRRRGLPGGRVGAPGPRRDRLHLRARPPLLPQARARQRARVRGLALAPRPGGGPGRRVQGPSG